MPYVAGKPLERWLILADLPRRKLALSNDPKVVETVMLDRGGIYPKSEVVHDLLAPLIGEGVFGQPGGTRVKETRRVFSRSLATVPDAVVRSATERLAREYVDRWLRTPGGNVGISEEFSRLTVDVVSEVTLGDRFSEEESIRFTRLFFDYHKKAAALLLMLAHDDPARRARIVREMGLQPIGAEMRELMLRRFVKPILSGARPLESAPFALALAQAGRMVEGAEGEKALLDEIAVMLLAGHETTASTLSWLAFELAGRPDLQESAALALSGQAAPGGYWKDAPPEAVADALAKEALRLYPPIGFYVRETREDVVFRDKRVPAKSFFVIAPWTLHRHKSLWSRPDEFAPTRWLDGSPSPARTSYMPFGLGARVCPGARFAAVEMEAILRGLLPRARLTLAPGKQAKPLGNLTSRPDREIVLMISGRGRVDG